MSTKTTLAVPSSACAASGSIPSQRCSASAISVLIPFFSAPFPPPGCEPLLDLVEPVHAPERLAVDHDEGRAEHASGDRGVDFALGPVLDRRIAQRGAHLVGVAAEGGRDLDDVVHLGNVHVIDEIGPVECLRELRRFLRVLACQPVAGARRRDARDRENRRQLEVHAVESRRAHEVALAVLALQRQLRQGLAAGHLEDRAEQDRAPVDRAPVLGRQRLDLFRCEIAVRRREVEIEVDRVCHACPPLASQAARSRPISRRWMSLAPS